MENNWPRVAISDVCELIVDCVNKTAPVSEHITPFKMLRTPNIKNGRVLTDDCKYVDAETFDKWTRRATVEIDDVLLTREAPLGQVGIVRSKEKLFLGQRIMQYRADKARLNPYFLLYSFLSPDLQHQFSMHEGSGSVVSHIRVGDCSKFQINLPPLDVQNKIADVLKNIDNKIELNRQINKTLEQMAQALFKAWFVDFDPVVDNALDAGFFAQDLELPDELLRRAEARQAVRKQSDFKPLPNATRQLFPAAFEACAEPSLGLGGWIPKGWSVKRLDEILELVYGKALKKTDRISGNYPVYGSGGVDGTHISSLVDGPGIIVGRKGTVGSIYWESNDFFPIDTVFYVKPKKNYSLEYCHELLKTLGLEKMNTDAAVPGLNRNNAYRLLCVTPCNIISDALSKVLSSYRHRIELCEKESLALTKLRDTLLPKLISGELRLDNIAAELATEQVN